MGNGSSGNTITFTYTAATGGISNGTVTLAVPAGWTAPVTTATTGCTSASAGTVSTSDQLITVSGVTLAGAGTSTITYGATSGGSCAAGDGATAPTTAGAKAWKVQEASVSTGVLKNLASSPSINVDAADGSRTLTTSTTNVANGSTGNTITFTYKAATGGISNGTITLAVPAGWADPITTAAIWLHHRIDRVSLHQRPAGQRRVRRGAAPNTSLARRPLVERDPVDVILTESPPS